MTICDICTNTITNKSPGVVCDLCTKSYHAKCIGKKVGKRASIIQPDSKEGLDNVSASRSTDESVNRDVLLGIQSHLKSLGGNYSELVTSVSFLGDKIGDLEKTIGELSSKVKELNKIALENQRLQKLVVTLSDKVESLEQQDRLHNIELQGVPECKDEDIYSTVEKIGSAVGLPISKYDIDAAFRVQRFVNDQNSASSNRVRNVVVKFRSRRLREEVLAAAKNMRVTLDKRTPELNIPGVGERLFINEHLTPLNKSQFLKLRAVAREENIKFVLKPPLLKFVLPPLWWSPHRRI